MNRALILLAILAGIVHEGVTDLQCMVDCQRHYTYGYCERICSY